MAEIIACVSGRTRGGTNLKATVLYGMNMQTSSCTPDASRRGDRQWPSVAGAAAAPHQLSLWRGVGAE
jgi:hypothetical protein